MSFKVGFSLEVGIEVRLWVRAHVVLLKVLLRDEKLSALLAFVELRTLFSWQLKEVLVGGERFLFESELFLEHNILSLLLLNQISDACGLLVALLVVQVERFRQRLQVVLRIDQVLDRHLAQAEEFDEMGVANAFEVLPIQVCIGQVLQELLELSQVDRANDFVDICVHH